MRFQLRFAGIAQAPEDNLERALGDLARIELLERASGGVARIGEARLARFLARIIHLLKVRAIHINLTTHFKGLWHLLR